MIFGRARRTWCRRRKMSAVPQAPLASVKKWHRKSRSSRNAGGVTSVGGHGLRSSYHGRFSDGEGHLPERVHRGGPRGLPRGVRPDPPRPLRVWPPVVLAPMSGARPPFRTLSGASGRPYVSEMITGARRGRQSRPCPATFGPKEPPGLQLYGVDPHYVGEAVRLRGRIARPPPRPDFAAPCPR